MEEVYEYLLTIPKGKIIGLLGKNGMGKTTLLKLINDLLIPTNGEVLINGEKPNINSKKSISYLPERTYLDKSMKISQIITFFTEFYDNFDKEKVFKRYVLLSMRNGPGTLEGIYNENFSRLQ